MTYILKLTGDPCSILSARLASSLLRDAGRFAITILQLEDAYLPAAVLRTFPNATRFLVRWRRISAAVYLQNVLQLLPLLPEPTACLDVGVNGLYDFAAASDSTQLAQRVVAAAYRSNLHELALGLHITTAAADAILQGLPHLQRASLKVHSTIYDIAVWRPSADLSHMAGSLSLTCGALIHLDMGGLSTASKLQALSLGHIGNNDFIQTTSNLPFISTLTALQSLRLSGTCCSTISAAIAQALTALQQLRSLDASSSTCPADSWAVLASLPSLSDVIVARISIGPAAPAAAATSIRCYPLQLEHTAEQLLGYLAAQLPQLQRLQAPLQANTAASQQQVASALQHHPALQELLLTASWAPLPPLPAWQQQQQVSTLSKLQVLDLAFHAEPDSLLADIAGCSKLTRLRLNNGACTDITGAGLAALEAGPCSSTLAEVSVSQLSLEAGAQLLRLQLPQLRRVELEHMRVPEGLVKHDASEAEQHSVVEGQLLPAGAGWKITDLQGSSLHCFGSAGYLVPLLTWCSVALQREV